MHTHAQSVTPLRLLIITAARRRPRPRPPPGDPPPPSLPAPPSLPPYLRPLHSIPASLPACWRRRRLAKQRGRVRGACWGGERAHNCRLCAQLGVRVLWGGVEAGCGGASRGEHQNAVAGCGERGRARVRGWGDSSGRGEGGRWHGLGVGGGGEAGAVEHQAGQCGGWQKRGTGGARGKSARGRSSPCGRRQRQRAPPAGEALGQLHSVEALPLGVTRGCHSDEAPPVGQRHSDEALPAAVGQHPAKDDHGAQAGRRGHRHKLVVGPAWGVGVDGGGRKRVQASSKLTGRASAWGVGVDGGAWVVALAAASALVAHCRPDDARNYPTPPRLPPLAHPCPCTPELSSRFTHPPPPTQTPPLPARSPLPLHPRAQLQVHGEQACNSRDECHRGGERGENQVHPVHGLGWWVGGWVGCVRACVRVGVERGSGRGGARSGRRKQPQRAAAAAGAACGGSRKGPAAGARLMRWLRWLSSSMLM